jgi:hypothetical protein
MNFYFKEEIFRYIKFRKIYLKFHNILFFYYHLNNLKLYFNLRKINYFYRILIRKNYF